MGPKNNTTDIARKNQAVLPVVVAFVLLSAFFFAHLSFAQSTGTARATLNLRSSPNGRDLGTNIQPGEKFKILQSNSSWVKIRRSNGKTGWIWKKYVSVNDSTPKKAVVETPLNIINQETPTQGELKNVRTSLTVRTRPSTRGGDIGAIRPGERFEILGTAKNGWFKIRTASGKVGYASDNYIEQKDTPTLDGAEVKVATDIPIPASGDAIREGTKEDVIITTGSIPANASAQTVAETPSGQTAEESRAAGIRLEAMKELKAQGMDREVAVPASTPTTPTTKTEDQKIEADCDACLAQNDHGPNRTLLDIGNKVAKYHKRPKIVPMIAGQCQLGDRYGLRRHPILGYSRMHDGQDVKTDKTNVPLRSPMKGVVISSGRAGGYGWQIKIILENGVTVSYNHMQKRSKFREGQVVEAGTVVGKSGSTGLSTGIHLHLETFDKEGQRFDPLRVFKRSEICGDEKDPVPPKLGK